ncbi:unnamed protein product [Onchocerca flexuosa]|uniref:Col_cuticle_N domain-containing protein n=1 Tax=Onchocerca flexuosa TaxID=387005 RepID=A0A183HBW4_9BILA|nr:unnamed protein product [Onchocerca flexuosa]
MIRREGEEGKGSLDDEKVCNNIFLHVHAFHDGDREPVFPLGYKRTLGSSLRWRKMEEQRERAYKAVAYAAVTFSLISILSVCITMPIVYSFVDHIQQQTRKDLQFCKVSIN